MIKKAVIFCGGKATRFNNGKPGPLKPLIKVNNEEILIKIIKIYANNGINELNNFFKKKNSKILKLVL